MASSNPGVLDDARLETSEPADRQTSVPFCLKGLSSYAFGLVLLLFVVFLWTTSNFLGSSIFADGTYAKPFFLTYLNTSVFTLAAAPNFFRTAWRVRKSGEWKGQVRWIRERYRRGGWRLVFTDEKEDDNKKNDDREGENLLTETYRDGDDDGNNDEEQGVRMSNSATLLSPTHAAAIRRPTSQREFLAVLPTAKIALQFCPLWFSSNYLALACLQHTSVASTTVLSSTSSIWTLAIGALSGTERFTVAKLTSVMASLLGIILISRADLTSTILYGYYTVFLKRTSTAALPLKINMSLLFGLMGLINFFLLAPLLGLVSVLKIEPFELPPSSHIWAIALVNSTASLIGDVSWAHALVLTSPLVVTVGLSLTIPVSLVGEIFLQGRSESLVYWLGSLFVIGGFVFLYMDLDQDHVDQLPL
ncbi:hypothetical protein DV735_g5, partial [Chaetothyriales sp. CBS 134920]